MLGVALPAWARDEPTVSVIVVGDRPAAAAQLQGLLETQLRELHSIDEELVGRARVARIVGSQEPQSPGDTQAERARRRAQLKRASEAYYRDESAEALRRLSEVERLQELHASVPVAERIELHLWRTAVFILMNNLPGAQQEAEQALALDPGLKVDLDVFRPSLDRLVSAQRSRGTKVRVRLAGLPAGAVTVVDSRRTKSEMILRSGRHYLEVTAPGYYALHRAFDANTDTVLDVSLAVRLPPRLEELLSQTTQSGKAGPLVTEALEQLADRLHADVIVVGLVRGQQRRVLVWRTDGLARWTNVIASDVAVAQAAAELVDDLPRHRSIVRKPQEPRPDPTPSTQIVDYDVTLLAGTYAMSLEGTGGGFHVVSVGAGPALHARARQQSFAFLGDVAAVAYGAQLNLPDGTQRVQYAGLGFDARIGAGYALDLPLDPLVWAGGAYHLQWANDVADSSGNLGVLPSHSALAPELGLAAGAQMGHVQWRAHAAVRPVALWRLSGATPSLGDDASFTPALSWGADATLWKWGSWRVGVGYRGSRTRVAFTGLAHSAVTPLADARLTEWTHAIVLSANP